LLLKNVVLLDMKVIVVERSERVFAAWTRTRSLPRNGGYDARYDPSEIRLKKAW
jgi:hypothetical protein